MQVDYNHPFERNMCEVHYASGSAIGYRFGAAFILTSSEDLKLTHATIWEKYRFACVIPPEDQPGLAIEIGDRVLLG